MDYSGVSYSKQTLKVENLADGAPDSEGNILKPGKDAPLIASVAHRGTDVWSDQQQDSPGFSEEARERALALAQAAARDPVAYPRLDDADVVLGSDAGTIDDESANSGVKTATGMKKAARLGDLYRCLGNAIRDRAIYLDWEVVGAVFNSLRAGEADALQDDRERLVSMIRGFLSAGKLQAARPAHIPESDEVILSILCNAPTAAGFFEAFAQVFNERAAWRDWGEFEPLLMIYQKILKVQADTGFDPVTFAVSNLRLFEGRRCPRCAVPRWSQVCRRCGSNASLPVAAAT